MLFVKSNYLWKYKAPIALKKKSKLNHSKIKVIMQSNTMLLNCKKFATLNLFLSKISYKTFKTINITYSLIANSMYLILFHNLVKNLPMFIKISLLKRNVKRQAKINKFVISQNMLNYL